MIPHITIIGSINFDMVVKAPRLAKEGEGVPVSNLQFFVGGKGANRALATKRLGAKATLMGAIGDDYFGNFFKKKLTQNDIDLSYVKMLPNSSTGIAWITLLPSGNNSIMASIASSELTPQDVQKAEEAIAKSDAIICDLEIPIDTVEEVFKIAKNHKVLSVLDAGPAKDCPINILKLATIVSPNETELEKLSGMPVTDVESAKEAGKKLLEQGVAQLVLKLSSKGSLWMQGNEWKHFPAIPVTTIDPTAAGDAFTTALTLELVRGKSMEEALQYANIAGALTTTKVGAMPSLPTKEEIEFFQKRN